MLDWGVKLIAKSDCLMVEYNKKALIINKEYEVILQVKEKDMIGVESELFPYHLFSIHAIYDNYWGLFFDLA